MPPSKETDGNNADIQILLIMLSSCGELNLDSKALAGAFGITRTDNALRKVKQVLAKHDYKFDGGRVTRIVGDCSGEMTAVESPKKTPAKRSKATGTPISKKRKLEKTGSVENGGKEVGEARYGGEVKIEIEEETA